MGGLAKTMSGRLRLSTGSSTSSGSDDEPSMSRRAESSVRAKPIQKSCLAQKKQPFKRKRCGLALDRYDPSYVPWGFHNRFDPCPPLRYPRLSTRSSRLSITRYTIVARNWFKGIDLAAESEEFFLLIEREAKPTLEHM